MPARASGCRPGEDRARCATRRAGSIAAAEEARETGGDHPAEQGEDRPTARKSAPPTSSSTTSKRLGPAAAWRRSPKSSQQWFAADSAPRARIRSSFASLPGQTHSGTAEPGGDLDGRGAHTTGGRADEDAVEWGDVARCRQRDPSGAVTSPRTRRSPRSRSRRSQAVPAAPAPRSSPHTPRAARRR